MDRKWRRWSASLVDRALLGRSTAGQKQSITRETGHLSIEELEEFSQRADPRLIPDVLNNALDRLVESSDASGVVSLLERVEDFTVFRSLFIQYYAILQGKFADLARPAPADDGSPPTLNTGIGMLTGPLKLLQTKVAEGPRRYAQALSCVEEAIGTMTIPSAAWPVIFDILSLRPDPVDEQLSLARLVARKHLDDLPDVFVNELLRIVGRMGASPNDNTCLDALCVFRTIGDFLAHKSATADVGAKCACTGDVAVGPEYTVDAASRDMDSTEPSICGLAPWKEFLSTGAWMGRDHRVFVVKIVIEHIFSFLICEFGRMSEEDQEFVERTVFDWIFSIFDAEDMLFIIDEMNNFVIHHPRGKYLFDYWEYLCSHGITGGPSLASRAFDGVFILQSLRCGESIRAILGNTYESEDC